MIPREEVRRILVINLGGMGDNLLSTPALKGLKVFYPDARITFLTLSRSCGILEGASFIDEIITVGSLKDLRHIYSVLTSLRTRKIDIAINMRTIASFWGAVKMGAIFWIINPRLKVGRDTDGMGFFLDMKLPETHAGIKHDIDYNIELIKLVGASAFDRRPVINLSDEDNAYADNILKGSSISDNDTIIIISPGAPYPAKRWPLKNFVKAASLLAGCNYKVIITGGREEAGLEPAFLEISNPNIISLIGKTTIKQSASLIKRSSVLITNDTGPMHIAASLGTPVVAIFGPGHITRFDPGVISKKAVALHKKTGCSPCEKKRCRSGECLDFITPEDVIGACVKLLKEGKGDTEILQMVS